jgi:hypothetical protein
MEVAYNQYKMLVKSGSWKTNTATEDHFVALTAKIAALKQADSHTARKVVRRSREATRKKGKTLTLLEVHSSKEGRTTEENCWTERVYLVPSPQILERPQACCLLQDQG